VAPTVPETLKRNAGRARCETDGGPLVRMSSSMRSDIYVEPVAGLTEEPLLGGDVTEGVVRVGDTVRRPVNPQSAAIHAYLYHLEQAGFLEAPRFLGVDGRGREVLTYIEGEIGGRPLHRWAGGEDVLVAIARFQRRMHDCSLGFTLPAGVEWRKPLRIDGVPPAFEVPELIGHNDMTPENLIFRDGVPVGIIDFDLAGPTTRLLDVIVTLRWWAPLCDPVDRDPVMRATSTPVSACGRSSMRTASRTSIAAACWTPPFDAAHASGARCVTGPSTRAAVGLACGTKAPATSFCAPRTGSNANAHLSTRRSDSREQGGLTKARVGGGLRFG
jgi:Phosphotransferase enzyme family